MIKAECIRKSLLQQYKDYSAMDLSFNVFAPMPAVLCVILRVKNSE
jgi:hypothetical protein